MYLLCFYFEKTVFQNNFSFIRLDMHNLLKIQTVFTIPHFHQPHSLFNPNHLVRILMDFQTDIRTYWDAHK